jgi:hypothetical protein
MVKQWICIWGEGYENDGKAIVETKEQGHFSIDNGYYIEDIVKVHALEIGESVNIIEMGNIHSVARIQ